MSWMQSLMNANPAVVLGTMVLCWIAAVAVVRFSLRTWR
jgi:hypothetical protein